MSGGDGSPAVEMPSIYDMVKDICTSGFLHGGITESGEVVPGFPDLDRYPCLYSRDASTALDTLPDGLERYFRRAGILQFLFVVSSEVFHIAFRRTAGRDEVKFDAAVTIFKAAPEGDFWLRTLGFGGFRMTESAAGHVWYTVFFIRPEVEKKVTDFLRASGVRIGDYRPPWSSSPGRSRTKSSSRRMGKELEHMLGFG